MKTPKYIWTVYVHVCARMFIAVLLMLPRTQNPSLSPVMRLQPAMGNADYCCYSIRQSACVCMCVLAREMEREIKRMGIIPGAMCISLYPHFLVQDHILTRHTYTPVTAPGLWISPSCWRGRLLWCCIATDWFLPSCFPSCLLSPASF